MGPLLLSPLRGGLLVAFRFSRHDQGKGFNKVSSTVSARVSEEVRALLGPFGPYCVLLGPFWTLLGPKMGTRTLIFPDLTLAQRAQGPNGARALPQQVKCGFQAKKNGPGVCWEPRELEGPNLKISKFQNVNPFLQEGREGPN